MNPIQHLQSQFVGRDTEIRTMVECIIAGGDRTNILCVGPPGTGKSMVTACMMKMFRNAKTFHTVFTHMSRPADLFGPQDISAFTDQGKLHYNTEGFATDCELVRLEEGTKATGPLQDMCLGFYADRVFANGNTIEQAKTKIVFIDSNELPNETNGAMLDRFFVIYFPMLQSPADLYEFTKLYSGARQSPLDSMKPSLDLNQFMAMHEQAMSVTLSPASIHVWNNILKGISNNLDRKGTKVSASSESSFLRGSFQQYGDTTQRGQGRALALAKARARRNRRNVVLTQDLAAALPALWSDFNYQNGIKKVIYSNTLPTYDSAIARAKEAKVSALGCVKRDTDYIAYGENTTKGLAGRSLSDDWSDALNSLSDAKSNIETSAKAVYKDQFGQPEMPCEIQDIINDLSRYENFCRNVQTTSLAMGV